MHPSADVHRQKPRPAQTGLFCYLHGGVDGPASVCWNQTTGRWPVVAIRQCGVMIAGLRLGYLQQTVVGTLRGSGCASGRVVAATGTLWKTHHQLRRAAEPRIASITSVPGGPTKHPVVAARGQPGQLCSRTGFLTGAPCGVPWVVMSAPNDAPLQEVSGE